MSQDGQEKQERGISGMPASAEESRTTARNTEDINVIKEKMKERPINKRKLLKRTMITASMAAIFGLIACLTFLVLEPVFSNWLYPEEEPDPVQLQEEEVTDEMLPEDMFLEPETQPEPTTVAPTIINNLELSVADYQKLYTKIYQVVEETSKSLVTVTGVTSDVDWFNNTYESKGQTSGLIVEDNGKELLILADRKSVKEAEKIHVTFCDGSQADAVIKQSDSTTGLSIIAVNLSDISETTVETIVYAKRGSSNGSGLMAAPVIALGRPMGNAKSVAYGMITSVDTTLNLVDGNYRLLTTNIYGSPQASGIVINMDGQILGIINQSYNSKDMQNLISVVGITDLLNNIEKLSNGQAIATLGIYGTNVPQEIQETQGVPQGAYVTNIVMDSPAMKAGIQSGDVIVKIGTEEIDSFEQYNKVMMGLAPETQVTITVMRQGPEEYQDMAVDVVLDTLK